MGDDLDDVRFGSSGIRGPYDTIATPDLALALGKAIGSLAGRIVIGRDARTTGPVLEAALTAGALSQGTQVTTLGVVPTPTLAYQTRQADLGVMVTASHNPPTDNGVKLWRPDGSALEADGRQAILDALADPPAPADWQATGERVDHPAPTRAHREALLDVVGPLTGDPRVVVDTGNGAAYQLAPELLAAAGARVTTLNAQPDGTFPGRPSETTPENLGDLREVVQVTDAVVGIAHDGDGDRCVIVDETGRVVPGDALIVLLAREVEATDLAVPIDTSRLVWEALPDATIEVTPVGDAFVSEALAQAGGDLGGEPSGAYIFPEVSMCPDGPHAGLLAARIAAEHGGIAKLVDALPTFETRRTNLPAQEHAKAAIMEAVADELAGLGEVNDLDGVRVDTEDGWLLVRPSGTEPKIRLTAEAADPGRAEALLDRGRQAVRAAAGSDPG